MIETKITCDGCSEPIVGRNGYPINDYIVVNKRDIPIQHKGGMYAIAMKPKLDRGYHFCNMFCIIEWDKLQAAREKLHELNKLKLEKVENDAN